MRGGGNERAPCSFEEGGAMRQKKKKEKKKVMNGCGKR